MVSTHAGSCRCGAIRFTIDGDPAELTTCDCSLRVKRNALMVRVPAAALRIDAGEDLLGTYECNCLRAKHHFCTRCGAYLFYRKHVAFDQFGVNVFCLDDFDFDVLARPPD